MKLKRLQQLKAEAVAAAEEQYPDELRYEPCWTEGKMMVMVVSHDGRGQLRDVGVIAK
jgi:hypothetical protein